MSKIKSKFISAPVVGATVEPLILQTNDIDRVTVAADGTVSSASGFTDSSTRLRPLVSGTSKAWNWNGLTTNKEIDFTDIPSWAKRITVMFSGVSTSSTSPPQIQIGDSGGIETTGYACSNTVIAGGTAQALFTTGFGLGVNTANWAATIIVSGSITISLLDNSTNTWAASGSVGRSDAAASTYFTAGGKALSGTLDRVRITTVSGADNFDAGTINIMWE